MGTAYHVPVDLERRSRVGKRIEPRSKFQVELPEFWRTEFGHSTGQLGISIENRAFLFSIVVEVNGKEGARQHFGPDRHPDQLWEGISSDLFARMQRANPSPFVIVSAASLIA